MPRGRENGVVRKKSWQIGKAELHIFVGHATQQYWQFIALFMALLSWGTYFYDNFYDRSQLYASTFDSAYQPQWGKWNNRRWLHLNLIPAVEPAAGPVVCPNIKVCMSKRRG